MNKRDTYYLERILEGDLDQVQDYIETAQEKIRQDLGFFGIHSGAVVTQNAAPDLNVLVSADADISDQEGQRIHWQNQQTVDCSQDYLGNPTAVGVGNDRYVALFAYFDTALSQPETDGNGNTVYTQVADSFEIRVEMTAEAVGGGAVPVGLKADAVLLCDILIVNGMVQILNADIDVTRREDYVRETGAVLADVVWGTPAEAISALYAICDGLATGGGIAFTGAGDWHDASGALASANVEDAINEIVADLAEDNGGAGGEWGADKVGSDQYATAFGNADLTRGSTWDQLCELADYVDAHINGGAPQHAAAAITYAGGAWVAAVDVEGALDEIQTDLSGTGPDGAALVGYTSAWVGATTAEAALDNRPESAQPETLTGDWQHTGGWPWSKTQRGGTVPPQMNMDQHLPECAYWGADRHWGHPAAGEDCHYDTALGYNLTDICVFWSSVHALTGAGSTVQRPFVAVLQQTDGAGAGSYPHILAFDPHDLAAGPVVDWTLSGFAGHTSTASAFLGTSMCTDGTDFYFTCIDPDNGDFIGQWLSATGTAGWLYDNAGAWGNVFGNYPRDRIKVVDDSTNLVALLGAVATGGAGILQSVDKNGAHRWRADGDAPAANATPYGGLCSDGTNVYFTVQFDPTPPPPSAFQYQLCSATIAGGADPGIALPSIISTAAGGGTEGECQECIYDGRLVRFVSARDAAVAHAKCGYYDPAADVFDATAWELSEATTQRHSFAAVSDGLNLWLHDFVIGGGDPAYFTRVRALPLAEVEDIPVGAAPHEMTGPALWIKAPRTGITAWVLGGRMAFDGDSVWVLVDDGGAIDQIARIPRAGSR